MYEYSMIILTICFGTFSKSCLEMSGTTKSDRKIYLTISCRNIRATDVFCCVCQFTLL